MFSVISPSHIPKNLSMSLDKFNKTIKKNMININDNYNLYSNVNESLLFASNLNETGCSYNIHFYWRVPKDFGRKQALPIKSAIAYNKNAVIYLWSNIDLSENEYLSEIKQFIIFKIWNPIEEIKNTFLEPSINYFLTHKIDDDKCWLGGDLFRLLCLHKYGGFYIDMDVVILRNLSPLANYEFLYQWGSSGTTRIEPNIFYNGAVMRLDKNSPASVKLLENTLTIFPAPDTTAWGSTLYSKASDDNLFYFPCAWFNTEWCLNDSTYIFEPFKEIGRKDLYEGAFTWHWHNKWDDAIENCSKFQILEQKINDILNGSNH